MTVKHIQWYHTNNGIYGFIQSNLIFTVETIQPMNSVYQKYRLYFKYNDFHYGLYETLPEVKEAAREILSSLLFDLLEVEGEENV